MVARSARSIQLVMSLRGVGLPIVLESKAGPCGSSLTSVVSVSSRPLGHRFGQGFRRSIDVAVAVVGASVPAVPVANFEHVFSGRHGADVELPGHGFPARTSREPVRACRCLLGNPSRRLHRIGLMRPTLPRPSSLDHSCIGRLGGLSCRRFLVKKTPCAPCQPSLGVLRNFSDQEASIAIRKLADAIGNLIRAALGN